MKLVRDKIPELYPGHTYRRAEPSERGLLLRLKLAEEQGEVLSAPDRGSLIEELADLYEVLDALAKWQGISWAEIATERSRKGVARGVFKQGWVLE